MKLTLVLLVVPFIQVALTLIIAKCIHAGGGPLVTDSVREPDRRSLGPSLALTGLPEITSSLAAMAHEFPTQSSQTSKASAGSTAAPLSA